MSNEKQYFTVKTLEEYVSSRSRNGYPSISFREALEKMREEGLLSSDGTQKILPHIEMNPEEFSQVFSDLPWDVSPILSQTEDEYWERLKREDYLFPTGQSVLCRKLLPHLSRRSIELEYFEMYYIVRGKGQLTFEDDSFALTEGTFCIMPPRAVHAMAVEEGSTVFDVIVRSSNFDSRFGELLTMSGVFSGFFRESLYGAAQPNFLLLHTKPGDKSLGYCFRGLATECALPDKHSWNTTSCWLKLLLSNALRSCGENVEIYRFPTGGNPRADCGEILQYIQQNYRTVRLSTLARQFHYNETYLSRMLQNYAHQSFTEIVRDIRMNRAVEYLVNSSLRVHEIAGLVGYSSVDHFSRAFKSMYGVSPQGFRRKNRK